MKYIDSSITDTLIKRVGSEWSEPEDAIIGNPITRAEYVTGTNLPDNSLVWIHFAGSESSGYVTALRGDMRRSDIFYGRPVLVKQDKSGMYKIVGVDASKDAIFSEGIDELQDQTPVYLNQLMYGTMHPVESTLQVLVIGAMYGTNWVSDLTSDDFSSGTVQDTSGSNIVIPTTNNRAIGVLVQVDPEGGTLEYKQSAEFNAALSLQLAYKNGLLPSPDVARKRTGYLKLTTGISTFTYDHIWEVPELFGSTTSDWPITLTANRTMLTNTQIVLDKLIVSAGVTLTIPSGTIMKVI